MELTIRSGSAELWVSDTGIPDGDVCILASGGPGCCDYLEPVSRMIDDRLRVIRFEQRGCGRSTADGQYDIETAVADMEAIRAALNIDAWIVGGHSWGANLALFYAMAHPERVKGLLYLAGNGVQRNREWSQAYHANLEARGERLPDMAYPVNFEVNRAGSLSIQAMVQDPMLYRRIADQDISALFVCAGQDIRPNWPAMQIAQLMRRAELAVIEGAEHVLWLTHSVELRDRLRRFLFPESAGISRP